MTDEEQAVLSALAAGARRTAAAIRLSISEDSVDAAVASALDKLHRLAFGDRRAGRRST